MKNNNYYIYIYIYDAWLYIKWIVLTHNRLYTNGHDQLHM